MPKKAFIEALVISAVDAVLSGKRIEDERIECKSELMPPAKARQLAGAANAALGDDIIWIVGVDEAAAEVVTVDSTVDLADWWAKVERCFDDQVAPGLTSLWIPLPGDRLVLALHFTTDRAPYAVKNPGGGTPELEIPWRAGTRTRSAKRHELLRTLLPTVSVPSATLLAAKGRISATAESALQFRGGITLYIEHLQPGAIAIPTHLMTATLNIWGSEQALTASPIVASSGPISSTPEGFYCSGPGTLRVELYGVLGKLTPNTDEYLGVLSSVQLKVELPVLGASRKLNITTPLYGQQPTTERTLRVQFAAAPRGNGIRDQLTPPEVQELVLTVLKEHFAQSSERIASEELARMTGLDSRTVQSALRALSRDHKIVGIEVAEFDYPLFVADVSA
ncbi:hypothetical protein [Actinoplanes sp. NPDC026623]|uniref:hypothetical protein n=1 Tax=Actinoplanes sp. NPDC026623 TaxID=3155610 RepID=UPI0034028A4B